MRKIEQVINNAIFSEIHRIKMRKKRAALISKHLNQRQHRFQCRTCGAVFTSTAMEAKCDTCGKDAKIYMLPREVNL